jgi:hypothetical protein
MNNTLNVKGHIKTEDKLIVTGNITTQGDLAVAGASTLEDSLDVVGASSLHSTLAVAGASTLESSLDVKGSATIRDGLEVLGNLDVQGSKITSRGGFVLYSEAPSPYYGTPGINFTQFYPHDKIILPNPNKIISLSAGFVDNPPYMTSATFEINLNNLNINNWDKYYIIGEGDHKIKVAISLLLTANTSYQYYDKQGNVRQMIIFHNLTVVYNDLPAPPTSPTATWQHQIVSQTGIFREISILSYLVEDPGLGKVLVVHIHTYS